MPHADKTKNSDAISLLKADHRKVEGLFDRYEKSKSKTAKAKLARDICLELAVHATIEEELFYPAIKGTVDKEISDEAYVEHDGVKILIAELVAGSPNDEFYDAKVTVLSEMVKHHVKEEEQRGGMFAQSKHAGEVDLVNLGAAMRARKKELATQMKSAGVAAPPTRSMKGAELQHASPIV